MRHTVRKLKKKSLPSLLTAIAGFFSLPFASTKQKVICKTLNIDISNIIKSKFETHPRYIVIIDFKINHW